MEVARLICCTICCLTIFLAGIYTLNKLITYWFDKIIEDKKLTYLNEQKAQIESVLKVEAQLKTINKRLEALDPEKQKENQETNLKYIINKLKNYKKIDMEKYLDILIQLNEEPTDV